MEGIGMLAGGVAHDFNNILCIVVGYSDLLLKELKNREPARRMVEEIHKASLHAGTLTRQLLAFSRKQVLAPVILDLNVLVDDVQKMLRRLIGEDIRLTCSFDVSLGPIQADPGLIEQILINFAVNSRDAMPHGGQFTIETRNVDWEESFPRGAGEIRPGPYVLLRVSDTGLGMDEATRARIFEPFFTTKEVGKGTGLGLSTVYGIVKQSNGHIEVESEPGKGTTFKVYLPRILAEPPAVVAGQRMLPLPGGTEVILLAEDQPNLRSQWGMALRSAGYTVMEACDGEEGVRVSSEHCGPIQLLVTDVVMPKKNGRQLAEELARGRPRMKVLYVSGYTDDVVIRHHVLEAETPFLQKPFTPSLLIQKVRAVLDG
jgi:CheY-like chemotaxis protein